jgi:hypothetical protein
MNKQKVVYTHNGILLNLKKNVILIYTTTWMNLENIMLSKTVAGRQGGGREIRVLQ